MMSDISPRAVIKMMNLMEEELKKRMPEDEYYALSAKIAMEGLNVNIEDVKKAAPQERQRFRNILIGDILDHAEEIFWDVMEIYIDGADACPQYTFSGHDTIPEEIQNLPLETWIVSYSDISCQYILCVII